MRKETGAAWHIVELSYCNISGGQCVSQYHVVRLATTRSIVEYSSDYMTLQNGPERRVLGVGIVLTPEPNII